MESAQAAPSHLKDDLTLQRKHKHFQRRGAWQRIGSASPRMERLGLPTNIVYVQPTYLDRRNCAHTPMASRFGMRLHMPGKGPTDRAPGDAMAYFVDPHLVVGPLASFLG
ncbi:hypothetical protein NDU88_008409 [Pleurodeles waltl]|uniref:Uncharacterized protein n=1 Tax=Pleurodeles waltl TaxID=8319 RepID=A0AAV7PUB6_PLEWA|nr:hypothetical protein NDU88_008409 [Pleurodeles waltl]